MLCCTSQLPAFAMSGSGGLGICNSIITSSDYYNSNWRGGGREFVVVWGQRDLEANSNFVHFAGTYSIYYTHR